MKCSINKSGEVLAEKVELANTFGARLKGLMFRASLAQADALLLDPCPQIHTCFMRFAIDVVFLDQENKVVAVLENLLPWRMSKFYAKARRTLELPAGSLKGRVQAGDKLDFN